jgi:hypothetical protein
VRLNSIMFIVMLKLEIEDKLDKRLVVKVWISRIMLFKPCVKNYYCDPSSFHGSTMNFIVCGIHGTHIIMYFLVTSPNNGFISEKYPSQHYSVDYQHILHKCMLWNIDMQEQKTYNVKNWNTFKVIHNIFYYYNEYAQNKVET